MNLVVCMKQVPDLQQIRIRDRQPLLEGAPLLWGEMDRRALEEAVRIKEKTEGARVIAVALGGPRLRDGIKEALATGADEAVLLLDPLFAGADAAHKASVLARAIERIGEVALVLCGEGSTDNYSGQTGPRLAELLDLPQVTYVRELELGEGMIRAVRSMEEGFEVVEVDLPALVTVTNEINQPRLASLRNILQAARKPVQEWGAAELGFSAEETGTGRPAVVQVSNLAPEQDRKQVLLKGTPDEVSAGLVDALAREGLLGRS